ncbi:hypothetical protein TRFO_23294 [Tritrichomonas foetus]|uniref:Uncharacterized protein n=1 Tax=Tritrichomonas foetus TaxID=1144522 RepID=A0A1J4KF49_9EUKA|nr:hypothetical protein TRFO_23294 [Tritrichomonas foetus]|eukprot:OHT08222.1 hypothetical protein TRFO_23294 [Tritrichomonas foetus]
MNSYFTDLNYLYSKYIDIPALVIQAIYDSHDDRSLDDVESVLNSRDSSDFIMESEEAKQLQLVYPLATKKEIDSAISDLNDDMFMSSRLYAKYFIKRETSLFTNLPENVSILKIKKIRIIQSNVIKDAFKNIIKEISQNLKYDEAWFLNSTISNISSIAKTFGFNHVYESKALPGIVIVSIHDYKINNLFSFFNKKKISKLGLEENKIHEISESNSFKRLFEVHSNYDPSVLIKKYIIRKFNLLDTLNSTPCKDIKELTKLKDSDESTGFIIDLSHFDNQSAYKLFKKLFNHIQNHRVAIVHFVFPRFWKGNCTRNSILKFLKNSLEKTQIKVNTQVPCLLKLEFIQLVSPSRTFQFAPPQNYNDIKPKKIPTRPFKFIPPSAVNADDTTPKPNAAADGNPPFFTPPSDAKTSLIFTPPNKVNNDAIPKKKLDFIPPENVNKLQPTFSKKTTNVANRKIYKVLDDIFSVLPEYFKDIRNMDNFIISPTTFLHATAALYSLTNKKSSNSIVKEINYIIQNYNGNFDYKCTVFQKKLRKVSLPETVFVQFNQTKLIPEINKIAKTNLGANFDICDIKLDPHRIQSLVLSTAKIQPKLNMTFVENNEISNIYNSWFTFNNDLIPTHFYVAFNQKLLFSAQKNYQIVSLPFETGDLGITIFLPSTRLTLQRISKELSLNFLLGKFETMTEHYFGKVVMPFIDFEYTSSNATKNVEKMKKLDYVVQTMRLVINPLNSTSPTKGTKSENENIFVINHPFLFIIHEYENQKPTCNIRFIGTCTEPATSSPPPVSPKWPPQFISPSKPETKHESLQSEDSSVGVLKRQHSQPVNLLLVIEKLQNEFPYYSKEVIQKVVEAFTVPNYHGAFNILDQHNPSDFDCNTRKGKLLLLFPLATEEQLEETLLQDFPNEELYINYLNEKIFGNTFGIQIGTTDSIKIKTIVEFDMHGIRPQEIEKQIYNLIIKCDESLVDQIHFIPGKGIHSANMPIFRQLVFCVCAMKHLEALPCPLNAGVFIVRMKHYFQYPEIEKTKENKAVQKLYPNLPLIVCDFLTKPTRTFEEIKKIGDRISKLFTDSKVVRNKNTELKQLDSCQTINMVGFVENEFNSLEDLNFQKRDDKTDILQKIVKLDLTYTSQTKAERNITRFVVALGNNQIQELILSFEMDEIGKQKAEYIVGFVNNQVNLLKIKSKIQLITDTFGNVHCTNQHRSKLSVQSNAKYCK